MKNINPHLIQLTQKISNLEENIKRELEKTDLVKNVQINGEVGNKINPFYLEYKIKESQNGKNIEAEVRLLRANLISLLIRNYSEILGIKKDYDTNSGVRKEYVELNPQAHIQDPAQLKYKILSSIKKEIENYMMRRSH
jgi:hypothetical protein